MLYARAGDGRQQFAAAVRCVRSRALSGSEPEPTPWSVIRWYRAYATDIAGYCTSTARRGPAADLDHPRGDRRRPGGARSVDPPPTLWFRARRGVGLENEVAAVASSFARDASGLRTSGVRFFHSAEATSCTSASALASGLSSRPARGWATTSAGHPCWSAMLAIIALSWAIARSGLSFVPWIKTSASRPSSNLPAVRVQRRPPWSNSINSACRRLGRRRRLLVVSRSGSALWFGCPFLKEGRGRTGEPR